VLAGAESDEVVLTDVEVDPGMLVVTELSRDSQKPGAVEVEFTAVFDLGMASLAAILDPIAEQALRDSIELILRGLLGEQVSFGVRQYVPDSMVEGS
jgi:hypothetical protein